MQSLFGCGLRESRPETPEVLPRCFVCPITKERLTDPVATTDGYVFEHLAISAWLRLGQRVNPVTGAALEDLKLTPLVELRKAIEGYVATRPELAKKQCMTSQSCDKAAWEMQEELLTRRSAPESFTPRLLAVAQSLEKAFKLPFDQLNSAVKGAAAELRALAEESDAIAFPMGPIQSTRPAAQAPLRAKASPSAPVQPVAASQALAASPRHLGGQAAQSPRPPANEPPSQRSAAAAAPRPAALAVPAAAPAAAQAEASPRTPSMPSFRSLVAPLSPRPKAQPVPASPRAKEVAFECIETFKGQEATVLSLSLVGSNQLAIGSFDGAMRLWDLVEIKELFVLRSGGGAVLSLATLSPKRLATGHFDGAVRIWDLESRREVAAFRSKSGQVWSLLPLESGRRLAAGSNDGSLRLWDAEAGTELINVQGHAKAVTSLAALLGGHLASGSKDGLVRLWDVEGAQEGALLDAGAGAVTGVEAVAEGRLAVGYQDGSVRIWDTENVAQLDVLKAGSTQVWSLLSLGGRLAAGYETGVVRVWDWRCATEVSTLKGHSKAATCLAALADGSFASGSSDGTMKIWAPAK